MEIHFSCAECIQHSNKRIIDQKKYINLGKYEVVQGQHPNQKWEGCSNFFFFFFFNDERNYSRIQFLLPKVISEVCLENVSNS